MKNLCLAALLAVVLYMPSVPTLAADASYCQPTEAPSFHFGFATLKAVLGPGMGDPTDCEHAQSGGMGGTPICFQAGWTLHQKEHDDRHQELQCHLGDETLMGLLSSQQPWQ